MLITDGGQQAIDLLCKAFLRPGDSVALENPAYPGAIAILAGARIRALAVSVETDPARTGHAAWISTRCEAVLMQNRVKFILVTPDFHNPTGTVLPVPERRRLLKSPRIIRCRSIEDSIYSRLRLRGSRYAVPASPRPLRQRDPDRQFFEDCFPGIARGLVHRSGTRDRAAAPGEAVDRFAHRPAGAGDFGGIYPAWIPGAASGKDAQDLSSAAWKRSKRLSKNRCRRKQRGRGPKAACALWLTLPAGFDAAELLIHARERGVLFVPAAISIRSTRSRTRCGWALPVWTKSSIARGIQILGDTVEAGDSQAPSRSARGIASAWLP